MNLTDKEEILIRRYLLGEVTDQEREKVELQLMTDRQYLDHILRREDDLIGEYGRNELGGDERQLFETYFLSAPERRDKLELAYSLNRYIAEASTSILANTTVGGGRAAGSIDAVPWLKQMPSRAAIGLLVVAALILMAGGIILLGESARLRKQVLEREASSRQTEVELQGQLDEQTARNEQLAREIHQSQKEKARVEQEFARFKDETRRHRDRSPLVTAPLILAPKSVRDEGQPNRAVLTTGVQQLKLELKFQTEAYQSYRIEVKTLEGKNVWREVNRRARQLEDEKRIGINLPASRLPEGDYLITLSGAVSGGGYEEVATYYFTVLRE